MISERDGKRFYVCNEGRQLSAKVETEDCPRCRGLGSSEDVARWTESFGAVNVECPVCEGTGEIEFEPIAELAALKVRLQSLAYRVWLLSGCNIVPYRRDDPIQHMVSLRTSILRSLKAFPKMIHKSCNVEIIPEGQDPNSAPK